MSTSKDYGQEAPSLSHPLSTLNKTVALIVQLLSLLLNTTVILSYIYMYPLVSNKMYVCFTMMMSEPVTTCINAHNNTQFFSKDKDIFFRSKLAITFGQILLFFFFLSFRVVFLCAHVVVIGEEWNTQR